MGPKTEKLLGLTDAQIKQGNGEIATCRNMRCEAPGFGPNQPEVTGFGEGTPQQAIFEIFP
ncbi:hypothetical protein DCC85_17210 [Paenibacillus sp. CAA11]|nr:hypothetical protein DCC85_17210 [Paenibacillus sp. CAA11]